MRDKPPYTFHLTPEEYFNSREPGADYTPPSFAEEGFIHCTDGAEQMAGTANRHYLNDPRSFLMLLIDTRAVRAPIRYDDPAEIYSHIWAIKSRCHSGCASRSARERRHLPGAS